MIKRLLKNEDGVALGLAVILIVIIGVMGAGLLVFVRNDLEAVVQVNQGQQAFEATDAGVQAAKRQLLSNACAESYDGAAAGTEDPDNPCGGSEESDWSYAAVSGENDTPGRQLTFDGKNVDVSVRRLTPTTSPADAGSSCDTTDPGDDCFAPDVESDYPQNREYFQIESTGESDSGDAKRRVEAIYNTYDLGVPKAYYTPNNITITGTADINNVSVFSGGDVTINNNAEITGEDRAYGNWQNEYNDTPRPTSDAGVGALGSISNKVTDRDFDGGTTPPFVSDPNTGEMTFPFEPGQNDQGRIDFLRDEAKRQGNYQLRSGGGNEDLDSWPSNDDDNTVVFVDFQDPATLKWDVPGSCSEDPDAPEETARGTLVVENGSFTTSQNQALLKGVVIVRGGEASGDADDTGGNTCIDGFVNASGDIKLSGNVEPYASGQVINRPGFYGVEQWSWRELYE